MLGPGSAQPPATLVASVAIIDIPDATSDPLFMQGAQRGGSSVWCVVVGLLRRRGEVLKGVDNHRSRRFGLMVNTLLSAVLLFSLTLMLLVLPVVLPPLPPPPPLIMLVPVVIFILLMLIAFVPSGFNAIVVSLSQLNYGVLKRSDGGKVGQYVADIQHSFASNSSRSHRQLHQANFNEIY